MNEGLTNTKQHGCSMEHPESLQFFPLWDVSSLFQKSQHGLQGAAVLQRLCRKIDPLKNSLLYMGTKGIGNLVIGKTPGVHRSS